MSTPTTLSDSDAGSLSSIETLSQSSSDSSQFSSSISLTVTYEDSAMAAETQTIIIVQDDSGSLADSSYNHIAISDSSSWSSDELVEIGIEETGTASESSVQPVLTEDSGTGSESLTQQITPSDTATLSSHESISQSASDSGVGLSSMSMTNVVQDSSLFTDSQLLSGNYIDTGQFSSSSAVHFSSDDANRGFLDILFNFVVDRDSSSSSSEHSLSIPEIDSSKEKDIHTYLERFLTDSGTAKEEIYAGTLLYKIDEDKGGFRTFGNVLVMRILGAVPGAPVYHKTLNMLARMINLMVKALTGYFYVPQHDEGSSVEKWRGASQYEQDGTLKDSVMYIQTSDTDFGAMSENQSVTRYD